MAPIEGAPGRIFDSRSRVQRMVRPVKQGWPCAGEHVLMRWIGGPSIGDPINPRLRWAPKGPVGG